MNELILMQIGINGHGAGHETVNFWGQRSRSHGRSNGFGRLLAVTRRYHSRLPWVQ